MTISAATERRDLEMDGCVPKEMLSYLKALGILKAIAEREDADARGFWRDGDQWVVRSGLDKGGVLDFFMNEYRPTPIMSPWNNGSGFQSGARTGKSARGTMDRIIADESPRLADWKIIHDEAVRAVEESRNKKATEQKNWILRRCRNTFPDAALEWLDAVFVLTETDAKYPPLFGSK